MGSGPPQTNSIFEIGSVSKTFTATLLIQFINEGLVSLDDPIDKFLPDDIDTPTYNGQQIKLRHLVTHTSGLPREIYNFNLGGENVWSEIDNDDLYKFLNDISRQAWPFDDYTYGNGLRSLGTQYRHSNVGMAILGHILELVSGQKYEQLVEERICSKLNMDETKTYPDLDNDQKARIPKAYDKNQNEQAYNRDQISKENGDGDERLHRGVDAIGMAWFLHYEGGDTIVEHGGAFNHRCHFQFSK